ncbi:NAD(P)/FAD-dependent oxidoreductase [Neorhizobium galegae]|uniref:NAD(P)/FAD-dependent oxidoreductase n=1 Tax=Neorhizobium galegae TaxID=399 RepID=UPI002102CAA5|nr:NAD(P)/FAD-dependent oxidoreductase [Neorhizobium galegae]MCQ1838152.1 NAD(P)/FAD-dependent oxidoreductase [Neorhizobium galegae]UIY32055.1 NAD(P)/FAD-dependent oxidoreductase [Neorhizobium galegae]
MTRASFSRRAVLQAGAALSAAAALARPAIAQSAGRVVVIGGGFAGATCARELKRGGFDVTLVEPSATYAACPFSNGVLAGLRPLSRQQFTYDALKKDGLAVVAQRATKIDGQQKRVSLSDGTILGYDRLVLAPGIDLRFDALPGYSEDVAQIMPHAWKAGEQTSLLRSQIEAMPDGGTVIISVPTNPYRCPPGPYERASLIAYYLRTQKPRAKLIVLDAKDTFSKQGLFQAAWKALYPNLEWVSMSSGGKVIEVDVGQRVLVTEFGRHKADVANVIPPQRAGEIAALAGATDRSGWCPIDPVTFESRQQAGIHIIGDACIAGGMPKSAFAANAQAKVCAAAIASLLGGQAPQTPKLINTCYSLVAPDYGITVAGVYRPVNGVLTDVEGAGGVSPADSSPSFRSLEASHADAWFRTITDEVFG